LISIVNYSVASYSNSGQLLMWLLVLGMVTGAVGRFLCSLIQLPFFMTLNGLQTPLWLYLFVMSFRGGDPLQLAGFGGWLLVVVNGVFSLLNGYQSTIIFQQVQVLTPIKGDVQQASRFVGLSNQIGAFLGTSVSFVLVISGAVS